MSKKTDMEKELETIFGRETITLPNPVRETNNVFNRKSSDKTPGAVSWGPVGAFFDWSVRPEFWDDQPFILLYGGRGVHFTAPFPVPARQAGSDSCRCRS